MRLALIFSLVLPVAFAATFQAEARRAQPHVSTATYTRVAHAKPRVHHVSRHVTHTSRRVAQARARNISPAS